MKSRSMKYQLLSLLLNVFFFNCFYTVECVQAGCNLKYKNRVDDKPDLFTITHKAFSSVCRSRYETKALLKYSPKNDVQGSSMQHRIFGLRYDAQDDTIFYLSRTDKTLSRLYKMRLNDSHQELVFDQEAIRNLGWPFASSLITHTAYDWISKNMYLNFYQFLGVVNVRMPWYIESIIPQRKYITNVAVHPNKGYLYFVDDSSLENSYLHRSIYKAHLDGSNIVELTRTKSSGQPEITSLNIDFQEEKLFWSVPSADVIQYSDLDGHNVHTISNVGIHFNAFRSTSRTMTFDRGYLYFVSKENSVRRLDKRSHEFDDDFEIVNNGAESIEEITAFTYAGQKVRDDHPCASNNGGCFKYCFAVPDKESLKRVCGCSIFERLSTNGVSCLPLAFRG